MIDFFNPKQMMNFHFLDKAACQEAPAMTQSPAFMPQIGAGAELPVFMSQIGAGAKTPAFKEMGQNSQVECIEPPHRDEVDAELCWGIDEIFADEEELEAAMSHTREIAEAFKSYQGGLGESATILKEAIVKSEEISRSIEKIYSYASMKRDQDTGNSENAGQFSKVVALLTEVMEICSFFEPEICEIPEQKIQEFLKEECLVEYLHYLDNMLRFKAHIRGKEVEAVLAAAGDALGAPSAIFTVLNNSDLKFPRIREEEGGGIELTHAVFSAMLGDSDINVRKEAYKKFYSAYRNYANTFATILSKHVAIGNFKAKTHNFKSAREASLFTHNVPESVFDGLIQGVNENIELLHRYTALRKKLLGYDYLRCYDLHVPVVEDFRMNFTIEEAKAMVMEATSVLGEDYVEIVEKAFKEKWIDFAENRGKRSGAYSGGSYDTKPYILMTWKGSIDNLYTLIHELGHSVHSYYTRKNQAYTYGRYPIFLAEIASTTNENLLTAHLLKNATNDEMRKYLLMNYLDGFKGTFFRQSQFAEFEHLMYTQEAAGTPLTVDFLCREYYDKVKHYYGPELDLDEEIAHEWARIPHFYYNYYVFQYATGFAAATAFAKKILSGDQEGIEAYKNFLKSGCSAYPIETLKKAGVDMSSPQPVKDALQKFSDYLDLTEKLSGI